MTTSPGTSCAAAEGGVYVGTFNTGRAQPFRPEGPSKIMIVDDEQLTIRIAREFLEGAGYHDFTTLTDAEQALEVMRRDNPDILLLDVIMPRVSGLEILGAVRADPQFSRLPVLVLTAASDAKTKAQALTLGATDFLRKPIDSIDLVLRVRNMLAVKHYQDNLEREIERQVKQLCQEAERTSMIIDTANDAFLSADNEGRIVDWAASAERLFGWQRSQMVNRSLDDILAPKGAPSSTKAALGEFLQAASTGKNRFEMRARNRDRREFPVEVSVSAMTLDGQVVFNAFVHDISERHTLQMQLAQAQKLESIGQLAAGIAHEINTPTQYISDNTRFLEGACADLQKILVDFKELLWAVKQGKVSEQLIADLEAAIRDGEIDFLQTEIPNAISQSLDGLQRVTKIVQAMKEFSHPGLLDQKTALDINKAIESTITISRNEWKYVAEMVTDLDPILPLVPCVGGDFNQVMLNLIVNAAHAIKDVVGDAQREKGKIAISTRCLGDWVEIRVQDTGGGIAEEHRDKIFNLFYTTKAVGKGTGQGLSYAHTTIVDKHNGTITFETEEGKGTTFIVRLPIHGE